MTTPTTNLFRAEKATLLIWLVFVALAINAASATLMVRAVSV